MSQNTYRKRFWVVISLLILFIAAAGSAAVLSFVSYTGRHERSCRQCHPLIYQLWKDSQGHPAALTTCSQCHARGRTIAPAEFLADDDLTAGLCLSCHEIVLDIGYEIQKQIVKFNHRRHIHEGMVCVDCHRASGHEYMTGGTNRPSIGECQGCHFREFQGPPENQNCLNCHDVLLAPGKGSPLKRAWITSNE